MPTAGVPEVETTLGISHAYATAVIFLIPGGLALVIEPILFLLSDRYPRRWFIAGGLGVMAIGAFLAASAPGPITLAIALAVWGIASGSAVSLSQATLVDRDPEHRARVLARWTLASLLGDLLAPLALAGLALLALSWREAFALVGAALALAAIAAAAQPTAQFAAPAASDPEDEPSMWSAFRSALGDRVLVLWIFGCALCDLLDEILVVFASLHLRHELGADPGEQAAVLGAFLLGGAAGLVALDRLLARHGERTLMIGCALACVASYAAWLAADSIWLATLLMLPVGATAAPLYPLAAARAFARCPGRSGLVLATQHLFTPLGLALPYLLGIVADEVGTFVALALLAVQPLGLAVLAAGSRDRAKA